MVKSNNWSGTHLVGEFKMPYAKLVEIFGEPHCYGGEGDKVDVEWCFEKSDVVFTLYNWKDGECYNGKDGYPIKYLDSWHVGGINKEAYYLVEQIINSKVWGK